MSARGGPPGAEATAARPAVHLAPLGPAEVPAALALHALAFGYGYPSEALREDLARPEAAVLAARDAQGALVGFGVVRSLADVAHVLTLAVAPAWRRRGVGRALLEALCAAARDRSAVELTLEVRAGNAAARALYAAAGLREVGRRRRYYADTGEDALLLSIPLAPR